MLPWKRQENIWLLYSEAYLEPSKTFTMEMKMFDWVLNTHLILTIKYLQSFLIVEF